MKIQIFFLLAVIIAVEFLPNKNVFAQTKHDINSSLIELSPNKELKPRVIVLTDAEIDDECSMVRFLLYANDFDIEGIITTSSQYHSHGHNWAGDDWFEKYHKAYTEVYPNLKKNDNNYPTPEYIQARSFLGNVDAEGEMDKITPGSQHIVSVLLNTLDDRPIWFQAWGGINTLSRALKTIEDEYTDKMDYVAKKLRFFFIWEQDSTYQSYIRPHWGKYNILTIISDQFEAIAYRWKNIQPEEMYEYFEGDWMKKNILENHGNLCSLYKAHKEGDEGFEEGDFRSEGDSPSFIYCIINGLREGNLDHPDWGSWGGRYTKVRENTWLDPVPVEGYVYPEGRWYTTTAWGRNKSRSGATTSTDKDYKEYFKPIWRWSDAIQNDFAARADWCIKSYEQANHPPVVNLVNPLDQSVKPGITIKLSAKGTFDPDGDKLNYKWWQYKEAGTYKGYIEITDAVQQDVSFTIPEDAGKAETIHIICEVMDTGTPPLTRYKRVVITIK